MRVCPDIDTTLYSLAGRQDVERGWGRVGETWTAMEELRGLGHDVWFNLGDRDLSTHLLRTELLAQGRTLSEVTAQLAEAMDVGCRVLPMCDEPVTTIVRTADGRELDYQQFLVREHARPVVLDVSYRRTESVRASAPGVLEAIASADVVVLAPSNPLSSITPILSVPGVRDALTAARECVVAVTPIVTAIPISDPGETGRAASRAALLAARGLPVTATTVASLYRDLCSSFVLDTADAAEQPQITALGLEVRIADTLLHRGADKQSLLEALGSGVASWR